MKYTAILISLLLLACGNKESANTPEVQPASMHTHEAAQPDTSEQYEVQKTKEEWKQILTSSEYRILRKRGTELPFVNKYYDNKKEGIYYCGACGKPIFTSKTKYKSGTGWPSFWKPVTDSAIGTKEDNSFFMTRTEVVCARCGSHLGHVFKDGPEPTGLRYCLNSLALDFEERDLSSVDLKNIPIKEKEKAN